MSLMANVKSNLSPSSSPLDLVICIDRSGSMGYGNGQSKLDEAKSVTSDIVKVLSDVDRVALVTFDSVANVNLPLTPILQLRSFETILHPISERGNTCLAGCLKASEEALKSANATKRVIILSDGRANLSFDGSGGFEGSTSLELELKDESIKLKEVKAKVIAVAVGTDAFIMPLKTISDATNGRLVLHRLENIPELVTAVRSETMLFPIHLKSPRMKNKMEVASFPNELPAGQPTWSLESIYQHFTIVSEEIKSTSPTTGEAIVYNPSNQRFAKIALMSIENEALNNYRERLPKTTQRVRFGEVILLDKSYRLELEVEKDSVIDLEI